MTNKAFADAQHIIINMQELIKEAEKNAELMEEKISWMVNGSRLTIEKPNLEKEEGDRKFKMLSEKIAKTLDKELEKNMR